LVEHLTQKYPESLLSENELKARRFLRGNYGAHASDADVEELASMLDRARESALEEASRISEDYSEETGDVVEERTGARIAERIRRLISK
jgi:predicted Zn-dependent protease